MTKKSYSRNVSISLIASIRNCDSVLTAVPAASAAAASSRQRAVRLQALHVLYHLRVEVER